MSHEVNHGRRKDLSDEERYAVLAAYTTLETSIATELIDARHADRLSEFRMHSHVARRRAQATRAMVKAFADCKPFAHKSGCFCLVLATQR